MAYHKQGFSGEALAWLSKAIEADSQNPLARFERASVLISQEKYVEAIGELESLKVSVFLVSADTTVRSTRKLSVFIM